MRHRSGIRSVLLICALALTAVPATASAALSASQKKAIAKAGYDSYMYGYGPVYMNRNVNRFPLNMVVNVQYLATELSRTVVKPNADTLYSIIVADVAKNPVLIHKPATGSRYFSLELLDGHTNVFGYIGTRATGNGEGTYAIVGPTWNQATQPLNRSVDGILRSATPRVWVVGRTLVDNQADVANAVAVQNGITAQYNDKVATNEFLQNFNLTRPGDTAPTPIAMSPNAAYFKEFGQVMAAQPPLTADKPVIDRIAKYGVGPGLDPNKTQSAAVMAELVKGAKSAQKAITTGVDTQTKASAKKNNGWVLFDNVGNYGTDYLTRAIIAEIGVGANRPEEGIYPGTSHDYSGKLLNCGGGRVYKIHFNRGQTPPVDGFWSITMYADDQFFISNPINRFAIGDRTPNLTYNKDGSLDIWVSKAQPSASRYGAKNWLPAPATTFTLVMRAYIPKAITLNGTWKYPKVTRVP